MTILFTVVGIILLIVGCFGLFLTYSNYDFASLGWIEGSLTYGAFTLLGLATIIVITVTPRRE